MTPRDRTIKTVTRLTWLTLLLLVLLGISISTGSGLQHGYSGTLIPDDTGISAGNSSLDLLSSTGMGGGTEGLVLARIPVSTVISDIQLPIYAHLQGTNNREYVLTIAPQSRINATQQDYEIIDPHASGSTYAIATWDWNRPHNDISSIARILYDDGKNLILRTEKSNTDHLRSAGLTIRWLEPEPMTITTPDVHATGLVPEVVYNPLIADMISQIKPEILYTPVGSLSGEEEIQVEGKNYTILTRMTDSGQPIQYALQYARGLLTSPNLSISSQNWTLFSYSGTNLIATKQGVSKPDEIVLVTAHLDSFSVSDRAPGADDDASGSVAVLACADIMSRYQYDRTLRFILFTGEEQGSFGSWDYAREAVAKNETIVAILNMDMISWSRADNPVFEVHTRLPGDPSGYSADQAIARTVEEVVHLYGLNHTIQTSILADGNEYSDHYSFWYRGYPGVLIVEDYTRDPNPHYHTESDLRQYLNMGYYTAITQATLATAAHLANLSNSDSIPLTARYLADKTQGPPPLTVRFTDTSTGHPLRWTWMFGDGSVSSEQNPVHTYQGSGRYTVTLEVGDTQNQSITRTPDYIITKPDRITGPNGLLWITSEPEYTTVYLDNQLMGVTPLKISGISAGLHQVQVIKKGYQTWRGVVRIQQGEFTYLPKVHLQPIQTR